MVVDVHVTNTGSAVWLPADAPHGGVSVGAHLYDEAGTLLRFDAWSEPLAVPLHHTPGLPAGLPSTQDNDLVPALLKRAGENCAHLA